MYTKEEPRLEVRIGLRDRSIGGVERDIDGVKFVHAMERHRLRESEGQGT
jgi:hypothetical protein